MLNLDDLPRLKGCRFQRTAIGYVVRAYYWSALSLRDVEALLAGRGVVVSYKTIRAWVAKSGPQITAKILRNRLGPADKCHLDEVILRINSTNQWLWRAIDANGDVLDILVQSRRAATGSPPVLIATHDRMRSTGGLTAPPNSQRVRPTRTT